MPRTVKLTKGLISRDEAFKLAPDYVAWVEGSGEEQWARFDKIIASFEKLKRKQAVITCMKGQYVRCTVSSIDNTSFRAVDGPVVRVGNGEFSWRVDGCDYAYPV